MSAHFDVLIVEDAEKDILSICRYISVHDTSESADKVFNGIKDACLSLATLPKRGHVPPELERIGIYDYLEIHYKPYRLIYQIRDNQIFIHCVLDGRRSLDDLLQERLIR